MKYCQHFYKLIQFNFEYASPAIQHVNQIQTQFLWVKHTCASRSSLNGMFCLQAISRDYVDEADLSSRLRKLFDVISTL